MFTIGLIVTLIFTLVNCDNGDFPEGFLIGTASAAYQVEGGWNLGGKSENTWDYFSHNHADKVKDHSNGDVACDTYHKYEEDADRLKDLGVDYYRFSLSWSRILPEGRKGNVSSSGLNYYHRLLDSLKERNIEPFVTIYHCEHPQSIEDKGGWLTEQMLDEFVEYARVVFREFGSRVKYFATINEPTTVCTKAYRGQSFPPNINATGTGDYMCVHNMLKAHALAYRLYDKEFRKSFNGKVGIVVQGITPYSKVENDTLSTEIFHNFDIGWLLNPILSKTGDYPKIMKDMVAERSKAQGLNQTRLPILSDDWIEKIKGSVDYVGLNHYFSVLVEPLPKSSILDWPTDSGIVTSYDPSWPSTPSSWLKIHPRGFRDLLNFVRTKYDNPPVYITENGSSDSGGTNDELRMGYLYSYMKEMLLAIDKDNCNVKAYFVWSFLDSFEWESGYTEQFGLYSVDFNDKNRTRTPKKSVSWLRNVLKTRKLHAP